MYGISQLENRDWTFKKAATVVGTLTGGVVTDGTFSSTAGAVTGITTLAMGGALTGTTTANMTGAITNTANAGTAGTGIVAAEYGDGYNHVTVLTLTAFDLGAISGSGAHSTGAIIYTFPAGSHIHIGTSASIGITGVVEVAADTPELSIGSLIGSGENATLNAVGATAHDYLTVTAITNCTGTAEVYGVQVAVAGALTGISMNVAASSKVLNLNVADTWAAASPTVLATGTVTIFWTFMG